MKITERRLRKLVREELERLTEAESIDPSTAAEVAQALESLDAGFRANPQVYQAYKLVANFLHSVK
jgi:hypothetical protein